MDAENKSKRQLQAEQTKDNLFIAAVELLTEKDFDDITIRWKSTPATVLWHGCAIPGLPIMKHKDTPSMP